MNLSAELESKLNRIGINWRASSVVAGNELFGENGGAVVTRVDPIDEINSDLLEIGYFNRELEIHSEQQACLTRDGVCTEETEESEESEEIKEKEETEESQEYDEIDELPAGVWEKIRKAILTCPVGSDGNTNGSLFDLAREVRGYEEDFGKRFSVKILKQIIYQWHLANLRNLNANKDYLIEFLDKLSLVRFPAGMVLVKAFEMAKAQPPPRVVVGFPQRFQLLARLCRELQRQAGNEPFFVDGRSVAKVLGEAHSTVASWLRALCRLQVIWLIRKGHIGHASRYRYICSD